MYMYQLLFCTISQYRGVFFTCDNYIGSTGLSCTVYRLCCVCIQCLCEFGDKQLRSKSAGRGRVALTGARAGDGAHVSTT